MKRKSAKERRVLIVALLLAALIVAGSTFAWYTSKDEVTNRLSASANYGVSIAESFHAPENWIPGQEINKDAAATNTGSVDAFVRMYLSGNMRLLKQSTTGANTNARVNTVSFASLQDVVDSNMLNVDLTKLDANGNYFKTLDKTQTRNPNTSVSTDNDGYAQNEELDNSKTGAYSEVQSMQSSILAYAPVDAEYCYVLDEEAELDVYLTTMENGVSVGPTFKKVLVPAGTLVMASQYPAPSSIATDGSLQTVTSDVPVTSSSGATHTYNSTVYIPRPTADFVPQNIEFESFTPLTNGLYLFLRNENTVDQDEPEFSGYYVDGITGSSPKAGTYYALNTGVAPTADPEYKSDYTVRGTDGTASYAAPIQVTYDANDKNIIKVEPTEHLELFNAQYDTVVADNLKWYYDSNNHRYVVLYNGDGADSATPNTFNEATDIAVIINLANIGSDPEEWTQVVGSVGTAVSDVLDFGVTGNTPIAANLLTNSTDAKFYYNNDLEAGDTTEKLVDKVKLYEGVTNSAYLAFDFDLNVHLDSVQVTYNENGVEADTAVAAGKGEAWKDTGATGGATGAASVSEKEIDSVQWTKTGS